MRVRVRVRKGGQRVCESMCDVPVRVRQIAREQESIRERKRDRERKITRGSFYQSRFSKVSSKLLTRNQLESAAAATEAFYNQGLFLVCLFPCIDD